MFDASTAHLFEAALGMKKIAWIRHFGIVGIPMVDTGAKFSKPSRFGDVVSIESTITELRRSSFVVQHKLFSGGDLAIEAHEIRVWAGADPDNPERHQVAADPARSGRRAVALAITSSSSQPLQQHHQLVARRGPPSFSTQSASKSACTAFSTCIVSMPSGGQEQRLRAPIIGRQAALDQAARPRSR